MGSPSPFLSKKPTVRFLMQLTPAARLGVIVFLLALAMIAVGLGIRSVTQGLAPTHRQEPAFVNLERA
jgi:hypothetical protein